MDFGQQRADFSDLMSLLGYNQSQTMMNNQLLNSDFQRAMQMMGLIPGMGPQGTDASGIIGQANQNGQQNAAMNAQQQAAQQQAYAQLAASIIGSFF